MSFHFCIKPGTAWSMRGCKCTCISVVLRPRGQPKLSVQVDADGLGDGLLVEMGGGFCRGAEGRGTLGCRV